jgi:hypothetical protein
MKIRVVSLVLLILMIIGCNPKSNHYSKYNDLQDSRKPISWGQDRVIYVFADDPVWQHAEEPIRKTLERFKFTNINESYFEVRRADIKNINQFFKFRNLVFLGNTASNLPVSAYFKSTLPKKKLDEIRKNRIGMFKDENLWANDQQVLFIAGDNLHNLISLSILQEEAIFQIFQTRLFKRIAYRVYQMPVLDESYWEGFPCTLQVPIQFKVYKKDIPGHFISFLYRNLHESTDNPDEYISVYYEKMEKNLVDKSWLIKKRSEIAWKYYDEDEFRQEDINIAKAEFNKTNAWEIFGRWQNKKYKIGGAFRSVAFWDASKKKAFIVDSSVFYPEGDKLTYLLELEAISSSFKTKP